MVIVVYKLNTGEEVICRVLDDNYKIENPLKVMHTPQGIALIPWSVLGEGSVQINPDSIIASYPPSQQAKNEYLKITTGIEVVDEVPESIPGVIVES